MIGDALAREVVRACDGHLLEGDAVVGPPRPRGRSQGPQTGPDTCVVALSDPDVQKAVAEHGLAVEVALSVAARRHVVGEGAIRTLERRPRLPDGVGQVPDLYRSDRLPRGRRRE